MSLDSILLLGDPRLYEKCTPLERDDLPEIKERSGIMRDAILSFRQKYGRGRAIAAPQIGYMKRMIVAFPEDPMILINPEIHDCSPEMMEIWDDCMSFPNLGVKVKRHKGCILTSRDLSWEKQELLIEGDLSELIQHEVDHLDGILAIQRAIDTRSFQWIT